MNEEKLAINILNALGVKDVTTTRQKNNGTTMFELPTGDTVAEFKSGYIRKYLMSEQKNLKFHSCYQLNPQYKTVFKTITHSGREFVTDRNNRMLIWNRAERLKRLFLYTIKKINNEL